MDDTANDGLDCCYRRGGQHAARQRLKPVFWDGFTEKGSGVPRVNSIFG